MDIHRRAHTLKATGQKAGGKHTRVKPQRSCGAENNTSHNRGLLQYTILQQKRLHKKSSLHTPTWRVHGQSPCTPPQCQVPHTSCSHKLHPLAHTLVPPPHKTPQTIPFLSCLPSAGPHTLPQLTLALPASPQPPPDGLATRPDHTPPRQPPQLQPRATPTRPRTATQGAMKSSPWVPSVAACSAMADVASGSKLLQMSVITLASQQSSSPSTSLGA